jgi:hypothetical protein
VTQHPLAAVPVVPPNTSAEPLPGARGILLRQREVPPGRLSAWIAALGFRRERRFELDAVGAQFWNEIDGRRSLADIRQRLCDGFGFDEEQAGRAVVEFTSVLMQRGLLALRVRDGDPPS